jgi:L-ascorbate oxidase
MSEDFYEKNRNKSNKTFYFELEYKMLNNPTFNDPNYYPIFTAHLDSQLYTPQINNISMHMPDRPLLSQWNDFKKVAKRLHMCVDGDYCSCTHIIEIDLNDTVEFILVDA